MPHTYTENGQSRHREEMLDIITKTPPWILRWGTISFLGLMAVMVSISAFIRYPDIVHASLTINAANAPQPVVTKIQGKIIKLLVKDGELVKDGQVLAYMESTAKQDTVLKYVLAAPKAGKLTYVGMIQEQQVVAPDREVFYVDPGNENFFGVMLIPQNSLGKIKEGQRVLVKLNSYPFEEYGLLEGKITSISNRPFKDSMFWSHVELTAGNLTDIKRPIHLRPGMAGQAEVITQDATLLHRITRNIFK